MNTGIATFPPIMDFLPMHEFRKCVQRYNGNHKVKSFSCFEQFLCMPLIRQRSTCVFLSLRGRDLESKKAL